MSTGLMVGGGGMVDRWRRQLVEWGYSPEQLAADVARAAADARGGDAPPMPPTGAGGVGPGVWERGQQCERFDGDPLVTAHTIGTVDAYEDYRSVGVGAPGRWLGGACEGLGLGLEMEVTRSWRADGTGYLAPQWKGYGPCIELVAWAPKSVSILAALHPDPAVRAGLWESHRAAVETLVAGLECSVGVQIAVAAYDHGTNSDENPCMHTHLIVESIGTDEEGFACPIGHARLVAAMGAL